MQALVVEFIIHPAHPAHVVDFAVAITANARTSREAEPGRRQFDDCTDPGNVQRLFLHELCVDEVAVQAHLQSADFLAINAATAHWVAGKTVWRCIRQAP